MKPEELKEIVEAFATIEKHDLKVSNVICTVCGHVHSKDDSETSPCEHMRAWAQEMWKES